MDFDEVRLPLRVAYGASGGVQFMTEVVTLANGKEQRNQRWRSARRRYDARTGLVTAQDAAVLISFFHARCGRARGFRLRDWGDFTSAQDGISAPSWQDQTIGTGNGISKSFQLVKTYGGGGIYNIRDIQKPVIDTVRIGVGGSEWTTGWSIDQTTGLVTFAQPPANGTTIYAGFQYDVPVRFDADLLKLTSSDQCLSDGEIPLIEVRV